jgi:hypothetical protein
VLTPTSQVAILGFGYRAAAFAALLAPRGCALRAWDPGLATGEAGLRARIEAAGVDAFAELPAALRGARLVVLDTVPGSGLAGMPLLPGQQVLDLALAPARNVDAALVALGVPAAAANWAAAGSRPVADSATAAVLPPAVPRGELP